MGSPEVPTLHGAHILTLATATERVTAWTESSIALSLYLFHAHTHINTLALTATHGDPRARSLGQRARLIVDIPASNWKKNKKTN